MLLDFMLAMTVKVDIDPVSIQKSQSPPGGVGSCAAMIAAKRLGTVLSSQKLATCVIPLGRISWGGGCPGDAHSKQP